MNYGKRLKLPQSARSESDYSLADDFDEDCRSNKRVNRNLSEKKRRDQFNMLVNELCSMVSTTSKKMDKSTVLKSTIAYLKSYQETAVQAQAHEIKEDWKPSFLSNDEFMHLMLEALDSFILVFTQQGTILYASESITSLLGHLPNDLMNKPVYDYIHENEMQNLFNLLFHFSMISTGECTKDEEQLFFTCHFLRGALSPEESPAYEIVKFTGFQYWNREKSSNVEDDVIQNSCSLNNENSCFCCIVRLQNSQFIREMSLVDESKSEFTSRHSLEWKFLFLDHRAPPIIGYLPFEVLGTSGYDYYHPDDLEQVANCHEQLMQTGEGTSSHYRFLTKGQQWIWIKTRYYITYHQWNSKPEFIVCSNFVVSYADVRQSIRKEVENENKIKNGDPTTQMQRSPSICSVTSGGRVRRSWSSSHSIESSTSDRNVSGSHSLDKDNSENRPHSTNVSKDLPQSVSQQLHLLLQQRYLQQQQQQQIQQQHSAPMVSSQMQNHLRGEEKGDDVASSSSRSLLGLSQDRVAVFSGSHTLPMVVSSTSQIPIMSTSLNHIAQMSHVANSHTNKGVISQPLYLTPIQRQLHEQLHEKSKKLQEMIIKQQEELKQITQQLSLAQQGILPVLAIPQAGSTVVLDTNTSPEMTVAPPTQSASLCGLTIQTMAPIISVQHHTPIQTDQQFLPFQLMPQEAELMPSFSSASPP